MDRIDHVTSLLKSVFYKDAPLGQAKKERIPFLTISRQMGAGGHTLTEAIFHEFQKRPEPIFQSWSMIDQEICERVIQGQGVNLSEEKLFSSPYQSEIADLFQGLVFGSTPKEVTLKKVFCCVRALAVAGKIILLGRGASCLTQDLPGGIHIRLVAPFDKRVHHMMTFANLTEEKAKRYVREQDEAREKLIQHYFGRNINDPLLYDVTWNSARVSMPAIATQVADLLLSRQGESPSTGLLK